MRWYELRITTEYATILAENANAQKALELLEPLVESYSEGDEFPDMLDAHTVLRRLG